MITKFLLLCCISVNSQLYSQSWFYCLQISFNFSLERNNDGKKKSMKTDIEWINNTNRPTEFSWLGAVWKQETKQVGRLCSQPSMGRWHKMTVISCLSTRRHVLSGSTKYQHSSSRGLLLLVFFLAGLWNGSPGCGIFYSTLKGELWTRNFTRIWEQQKKKKSDTLNMEVTH